MSFLYTLNMVIYIDLYCLLNFFIDLLLLLGLDSLLKRNGKFKRIILGSIVGSLFCLFLFYIKNNILLIILKIIISILMILISFGYKSFKYFRDNFIWLYIISIVLGGSLYLVSNSFKEFKINIIILVILSPLIIYKYIKENKKLKIEYSSYMNVGIYYNDLVINEVGFLDTGNSLRDPFFNRPIIICDKSLFKDNIKTFLVPYRTIDNNSLLEVFKPKKVLIEGKRVNALVGLSKVDIDGVKILLNKEIL